MLSTKATALVYNPVPRYFVANGKTNNINKLDYRSLRLSSPVIKVGKRADGIVRLGPAVSGHATPSIVKILHKLEVEKWRSRASFSHSAAGAAYSLV